MKPYANNWQDFPDYIIGITKQIWEDRGIESLNHYYAPDIVVRSPMGIQRGNESVKASTMTTIHEFPDRQLFGEDVIWSETPENGHLSSHRLITKATHLQDGQFGKATGKPWTVRVIADCAAKGETIYDEWLVRDYGGIVRQLGYDPAEFAAQLIEKEGGPEAAQPVFLPENDIDGGYHGRGNDNAWGQKYADILNRIMAQDFNHIFKCYDRAVIGDYAGGKTTLGRDDSIGWVYGPLFPRQTLKFITKLAWKVACSAHARRSVGPWMVCMRAGAALERPQASLCMFLVCVMQNLDPGACAVNMRFMTKSRSGNRF